MKVIRHSVSLWPYEGEHTKAVLQNASSFRMPGFIPPLQCTLPWLNITGKILHTHLVLDVSFSGVDQSFFLPPGVSNIQHTKLPWCHYFKRFVWKHSYAFTYSDQLLNCVTIKRTLKGHFNDYLKVWSYIFCSTCHNVNIIISIFWLVINKTCMAELIFVWPVNMTSKLITIFESCKNTGCWPRFWKNSYHKILKTPALYYWNSPVKNKS